MSYDSYGNQCSICSISTPFGFEGGYTDATGLIYLVRRYYDPATSQFLSVDPLVNETGTPYAFTGGDPVNGTDSSGLGSLWNPCSWGNVCHHIGNVVNGVTSSSAYTWFNQHLNPAYLALTGYHNEWQATESGCSLSTELKYGGQGVLGVAGTLGAAGGGELLGGVRALGPLDETGAVGVGFSGDQRALVQLAKLAKQTGGVTQEEAQTLVDWADETGLQSSGPEIHLGRPGWGGQNVHIQIGPVNHIPVLP